MATISSGIGLISGLDYTSLVNQLIAIDARPRDQLLGRMRTIDAQRTAYMDISARLAALLSRITALTRPAFFRTATATSSHPSVLGAAGGENAQPGTYTFQVRSLATTHQLVSRGFVAADTPLPAGTLTLESAAARVNRQTALADLNGWAGVQRGAFVVIDGNGRQAAINVADAQTVGDVLDRINAANIDVAAELRGEALFLRDTSGGSQGLRVREVGDGRVAADLGFGPGRTFAPNGELLGSEVLYLAGAAPLTALNDGLGLRRAPAGTDFTIRSADGTTTANVSLAEVLTATTRLERLNHARGVELGTIRVTTRNGQSTTVDLSAARTIGEVKQTIEGAVTGVMVVMAGGRLMLTDTTGGTAASLSVQDVSGHAARDLGILGTGSGNKIDGNKVLYVDTLADVVAAINYAHGNQSAGGAPVIEAALAPDGRRLQLRDHGGTGTMTIAVPEGSPSRALGDLGFAVGEYEAGGEPLAGRRILGGLHSVLLRTLNGGRGFAPGVIRVQANGGEADIDLGAAETLRDVIERINAAAAQAGLNVTAGYDPTGTRLQLVNGADQPGPITVTDVSGDFAAAIGLTTPGIQLRSRNLQRQYLSETTRLGDLNLGAGVSLGTVRITDSRGRVADLNFAQQRPQTLQDVISAINGLSIDVEARINDTGDGLLIRDTAGGSGALIIADLGGTTARDLNIAGQSTGGERQIDGSYEIRITTSGSRTLSDLAARINATTLARANVISDGSPTAPYRLSITAAASGRRGELILDDQGLGLGLSTLTRPLDASLLLGEVTGGGVLITSATNTFTNVIGGVTLTATGVAEQPVTVTVAHKADALVATLKGFVDDYNGLLTRLAELTRYDSNTQQAAVLFGEGAVQALEGRLYRAVTGRVPGEGGRFTRLSELGVMFADGARLRFDEAKFRAAYEQDPEAVARFFTAAETGLALRIKGTLESLTATGGLLRRQDQTLQGQRELLASRVEVLNERLDRKRERMLRQFRAMEQALAQLQSQQTALTSLGMQLQSLGSGAGSLTRRQ